MLILSLWGSDKRIFSFIESQSCKLITHRAEGDCKCFSIISCANWPVRGCVLYPMIKHVVVIVLRLLLIFVPPQAKSRHIVGAYGCNTAIRVAVEVSKSHVEVFRHDWISRLKMRNSFITHCTQVGTMPKSSAQTNIFVAWTNVGSFFIASQYQYWLFRL